MPQDKVTIVYSAFKSNLMGKLIFTILVFATVQLTAQPSGFFTANQSAQLAIEEILLELPKSRC